MKRAGWFLFVTLQVASWAVHRTAWMTSWYAEAQVVLAMVSLAVAWGLLIQGPRTPRLILLVLAGLLVGQWHVWSGYAARTIWHARGFAP